ncbi:MAG: DUF3568 family protein [Ignavibacteria bacterium]
MLPNTSRPRRSGRLLSLCAVACLLALAACDPVSLTMMGVGAGAGVGHELGGIVYKTFTAPEPQVKKAAFAALKRMAIKVTAVEKIEGGEKIKALAGDRNIEIELDSLTPNTTRMRAVARKDGGVIVDSATAVEIITQTERMLGANGG